MNDPTLAACLAIGFVLGVLSGLTRGLHLNNFAAMLLALPGQRDYTIQMALLILAASISQTFFDAIPAIFLGAPDSDTALTVLPGQRLMLEGRGIEAVRLSALGSAGSILVALLLV